MKVIKELVEEKDIAEVITERREEELKTIGFESLDEIKAPVPKTYAIRAMYKDIKVEITVDNDYVKSKGERAILKHLTPYLIVQLKKKDENINKDEIEFGFFKNNRQVKYKSFVK